jgi:hypothetical protein
MSMRKAVAILVAVTMHLASAGAQQGLRPKPAWLWSSDERVAARLDPVGRKARLEEYHR